MEPALILLHTLPCAGRINRVHVYQDALPPATPSAHLLSTLNRAQLS